MSIHRTKNGTWIVRYRTEHVLKSKTFKRKDDAKAFEAAQRSGQVMGGSKGEELTFEEVAQRYLEVYAQTHLNYRGWQDHARILERDFTPIWRGRRLGTIKKEEVERLQAELKGRLNPKSVNNRLMVLGKLFKKAVEWELVAKSPMEGLTWLKLPDAPFHYWAKEESDRFLSWADLHNPKLYYIVALFLNTGLRRNEMQALTVGDLNFETRQIRVNKSYDFREKVVHPWTKHKKNRVVPMNDFLAELLAPLQGANKSSPVIAFTLGRNCNKDALPTPKTVENLSGKHLKKACAEAGVSHATLQDLRHSFASQLAIAGVSAYQIMRLLGHADIRITMRYMHLAPSDLRGVTNVLGGRDLDKKTAQKLHSNFI